MKIILIIIITFVFYSLFLNTIDKDILLKDKIEAIIKKS